MATEVVWTEPALDELNEIYTYYSEQKANLWLLMCLMRWWMLQIV